MMRYLLLFTISLTFSSVSDAQSIRKPWYEMTGNERSTYVDRVNALYLNGTWDQFVSDHAQHPPHGFGQHGQYFVVWHRHYLYYMERALGVPLVYLNWMYEDVNGNSEWNAESVQFKDSGNGKNGLFGYDLDPGLEAKLNRVLGPNPGSANDSSGWINFALSLSRFIEFQGQYGFNENLFMGTHNFGHGWVGGAMGPLMTSPTDPVFYNHHAMVDMLFQWGIDHKWKDSTVWSPSTPAIGTVTGGPTVHPHYAWDSREYKVWYAYNNLVQLYDYQVRNTELYKYSTGKIAAYDFVVPGGTNCTFNVDASQRIILQKGFRANKGSRFRAMRSNIGGPSARMAEDNSVSKHKTKHEEVIQWALYPNPAHDRLNVKFNLAKESKIDFGIHDVNGRVIIQGADRDDLFPAGPNQIAVDIHSLPAGVYFLKYVSKDEQLTRLFIKK